MSRRSIDYLCRIEYLLAADAIPAPFDASPADKVNIPAKNILQIILHLHVVQEAPLNVPSEGHKHIDIAVRTEIFPQNRAEQRELGNLPSPAEFSYLFSRNRELFKHVWPPSVSLHIGIRSGFLKHSKKTLKRQGISWLTACAAIILFPGKTARIVQDFLKGWTVITVDAKCERGAYGTRIPANEREFARMNTIAKSLLPRICTDALNAE